MTSLNQLSASFVVAFLAILSISFGQGVRECPPEPVPTAPCPVNCTTCDEYERCIIVNPEIKVISAPSDRPTIVRCLAPDSCEGLFVQCSTAASCDVVCGFGACNGINMDCRNSNFSCNLICSDPDTRTGQVRCNSTQSCNCRNTCGAPYNCTAGVSCPGDVCFNRWDQPCFPYRASASELVWTYDPAAVTPALVCDCACANETLIPSDIYVNQFTTIRYCVNPDAVCTTNDECGSHGICEYGQCTCFYGWEGQYCESESCVGCLNAGVCNSDGIGCICTGGHTGEICEDPPTCELVAELPPDCPPGCDECIDEACVIHARKSRTDTPNSFRVSCPPEAVTMRCVLMCDSAECFPLDLVCTSNVSCDFICVEPGDCSFSYFICENPNVPCRAQCPSPNPTARAVYSLACPAGNDASCAVCDSGDCEVSSRCTAGVNCPGDPCSGYENTCVGGFLIHNTSNSQCYCDCLFPLVPTVDQWGYTTCVSTIESQDCPCEDYADICVNNTCLCAGPNTGPYCNITIDTCPALPDPYTTSCPYWCTSCNTEERICNIVNPSGLFDCPVGWRCVVKCYDGFCQGITGYCTLGSGPCDVYCFGRASCLMLYMDCDTDQPCRVHCTSSAIDDYQVIETVACPPPDSHTPSCDCSSTCPQRLDVTNPCILSSPRLDDNLNLVYLPDCGADVDGNALVPRPINSTFCECTCSDPAFTYDSFTNECIPPCNPPCNNGGRCVLDTESPIDLESTAPPYKCLCLSGYSGKTCDFRCFFPIPVDIISCENGVYVIRADLNVPANTSLNVLLDSPDARILRINGSIIIQSNSSASFASNSTNRLEVTVGGNLTQLPTSTISTSIISVGSDGSVVGTLINVTGTAFFSGSLNVDVDASALANLTRPGGALTFTVFSYGSSRGQFTTITTNLPTVLEDGCSKPIARSDYGTKSLSLIITIDSSACGSGRGPTQGAGLNGSPVLFADISGSSATGAIAGSVVAAVVVVGLAIGGVVLWRRKRSLNRKKEIAMLHRSVDQVEMNQLSPRTPSAPISSRGSWRSGSKGSVLKNVDDN